MENDYLTEQRYPFANKWVKYNYLKEDPRIAVALPETYLLSRKSFWRIFAQSQEVILKPIIGCFGYGVIKVSEIGEERYEIHQVNHKIRITGKKSFDSFIEKQIEAHEHNYLVQYSIPLAKVEGKPIDFRYIVQRKKGTDQWVITGKHAKVAAPGYVVTNLSSNGEILPLEEALLHSDINNLDLDRIMKDFDDQSLAAARCLSRYFPDHHIWGLDVGVDDRGGTWIIEANYFPRVGGFRKLEDLTMHETIQFYLKFNNDSPGI